MKIDIIKKGEESTTKNNLFDEFIDMSMNTIHYKLRFTFENERPFEILETKSHMKAKKRVYNEMRIYK